MPLKLRLVPIDPFYSHLNENIEVKYNVQEKDWGPPDRILLFKIEEQLDHVAVDHDYSKQDEVDVGFDLEL